MAPGNMEKRIVRFLVNYSVFIAIIVIGFFVWFVVFNQATSEYLIRPNWNNRAVWVGNGEFTVLNQTFAYQLEGYSDYSFFYVHWGHKFLNGTWPYTPGPDGFGHLVMDGITNNNGAYIFPPLYSVLDAGGIALNPFVPENTGIGLLSAIFGFITIFPTYGIAHELSKNRRVAEAAALTYILSPSPLYHIAWIWLNTAPVVFFFFSGFYMLIRGRRQAGTLLIVVAALFKQIAWFLGIPLVVYLLLRWRYPADGQSEPEPIEPSDPPDPSEQKPKEKDGIIDWLRNASESVTFFLGIFAVAALSSSVLLVLSFVFPSLTLVFTGILLVMAFLGLNAIFLADCTRNAQIKNLDRSTFVTSFLFTIIIFSLGLTMSLTVFMIAYTFPLLNAFQFMWWPIILSIYFLMRYNPSVVPTISGPRKKPSGLTGPIIDLRAFILSVLIVLAFAGAILLPFYLANRDTMLRNIMMAAGGFELDSFTTPPGYSSPMRFQVLPVVMGMPELAEFVDDLVYQGFLLWIGVIVITGLMLLEVKRGDNKVYYFRRLLFLAMIMMFWVHLMGPRGVYKYYFVIFAPFFSIFASSRMVTSKTDNVPFSASMIWMPFVMICMILLPSRNVYFFGIILILIGYLLATQMGTMWWYMKGPFRMVRGVFAPVFDPLKSRFRVMQSKIQQYITDEPITYEEPSYQSIADS
ncbi:MAG: hypothetical protein RTU30_10935 [Candidatus Thorarchaeota archaeon]